MILDFHQISQLILPVAQAAEEAKNVGVAETLGVNWMLFVAQLINFGILLFVLWKFAFNPVAKKLQERTEKIEKSLNDADRITKEKQEFEIWRQTELTKARQEASGIVTTAQNDAVKAKQSVVDQAKAEQQKLIDQAKKQIAEEKDKALQAAKGELADLITNATEKILKKKLDTKADQEYIKESLKEV